jgi:hypothetical protein
VGWSMLRLSTILHDNGRYRMYYVGVPMNDADEEGGSYVCLAESTDGVHWIKPNLGLVEFEGRRTTTSSSCLIGRSPMRSTSRLSLISVPACRRTVSSRRHVAGRRHVRARVRRWYPLAEMARKTGLQQRSVRLSPEHRLLVGAGATLCVPGFFSCRRLSRNEEMVFDSGACAPLPRRHQRTW